MPIGMNKYVPKYEKEENGSSSQPRGKICYLENQSFANVFVLRDELDSY